MEMYKELYIKLFNTITDVVLQLQDVQLQAEELFMLRTDSEIREEQAFTNLDK